MKLDSKLEFANKILEKQTRCVFSNFQWVAKFCEVKERKLEVPSRGLTTRSVASRKVVTRKCNTEGSEPAKVCTEEHELYKRH